MENVEVSCCKGSRNMAELIAKLRAMRAELVEAMTDDLAAEGAWHTWLPLLAQVETAIQAVEAAGDGP